MSSRGGFCTHCGYRVDSFAGLSACPSCGTDGVPCADVDQVSISINWHELRILTIWAEHYGRSIKAQDTVYAIARRVEDQHPDRALETPLSFAGEMRQLKDAHPSAELLGNKAEQIMRDVDEFRRINDLPEEGAA